MYPRAKFNDGLSMIEKLGHSKRIQLYRKQWIDEGKPNRPDDQPADVEPASDDVLNAGAGEDNAADQTLDDGVQLPSIDPEITDLPSEPVVRTERESSVPGADELDALLYENS